ncbi:MAG: hypothetical protein NTX25_11380 [Proteobacteria bacterium]|nr:hypothetical protein [Pseudomonadota bacterium]
MKAIIRLALSGFLYFQMTRGLAASLWPAGEGVCLGSWSYQTALTCEVRTGEPKYSETPRYPMKNQTCDSWVFGEEVLSSESRTVEISHRTGVDNAQDAVDWCAGQNRIVSTVNDQPAWDPTSGFRPERVLKQYKGRKLRIEGTLAICQVDLIKPAKGTGPSCGTIPDTDNPIYDIIGEKTVLKADISCGVEQSSLPRGSNRADFAQLPTVVASSFVCSTGDDLPVNSDFDAQAKAALLNKQLLTALRLDNSECSYKQDLAQYALDLVTEHGAKLAGSQGRLLGLVANNIMNSCQ